jgi:hypothetical protein
MTPAPTPRNKGTAIAVASIVLAAAALIVAVIALTRSPTSTAPGASTASKPAQTTAPADTTAANRSLCTAIAPLMADSDRTAQAYSNLGPANSPAFKDGVPKFISDTRTWVGQVQPVIDSHPDADPFLRRSFQRFVDDRRYLIADLEAGPWQPYDQTNWNDSLSALGGPLAICWDLGVKW